MLWGLSAHRSGAIPLPLTCLHVLAAMQVAWRACPGFMELPRRPYRQLSGMCASRECEKPGCCANHDHLEWITWGREQLPRAGKSALIHLLAHYVTRLTTTCGPSPSSWPRVRLAFQTECGKVGLLWLMAPSGTFAASCICKFHVKTAASTSHV